MRTALALAALGLFGLVSCSTSSGVPKDVDEVVSASVLVNEFETVFRANRPLLVSATKYGRLSIQETAAFATPFWRPLAALEAFGKSARAEILGGVEAAFVGARGFQPPKGLGSVRSTWCGVLLRGEQSVDVTKYFAGRVDSVQGSGIRTWTAPLFEFGDQDPKPTTVYATQVQRAVLVSNDLAALQAVRSHLAARRSLESAVLSNIRDWDVLKTRSYWGYRRYRHAATAYPEAAGLSDVSEASQALVLFVNDDQSRAVLRLLSSTSNDPTAAAINARNALFPALRRDGTNAWEATIPLNGDQDSVERMLAVMWLFGFGTYL